MGPLPRTMIECLLWSCAIVFYISLAQEGESKKLSFCYVGRWYHDNGEIQKLKNPHSYCSAKNFFKNKYGAVEFEASGFYPGSALNAHGSNVQYCARKAGEILLEHLRAGKMKNNAAEALEEFMATSSTSISMTKATSTEPSTTAGTTITTETTTTATSTSSSEFSTTATSTSPTEISTTATSTSPTEISTTATSTSPTEIYTTATSTSPTKTSATATSATLTEVSTTFATTSEYEYSDTPTTSAYDDQGFITDKESPGTSKTEAAEHQPMYSLLGQYGLAVLVACAISLIVIIAIIPVMMRNRKRNEHVEGAVGKRGTSKLKGSQEMSNEGSRESKSKEGGSKEVMTLSKE
uniref:Mucin-5AC-like n=1 Tax=Haemonchus contortus TaxID=6289 RepID=A0A7I5EEV5_HAECO